MHAGCSTNHAKQDTDVLIVQTAVPSARTKESVIIGDDADSLVGLLLLYHAEINAHDLFLASEAKYGSSIWCIKQYVWYRYVQYHFFSSTHYWNGTLHPVYMD